MMKRAHHRPLLMICVILTTAVPSLVHAQLEIDLYGGWSSTLDSDVRLQRPGGIKLRFHDVAWEGRSFDEPIYYGGRLSYWTRRSPHLGLAVDFTHAKIHARLDRSVRVTGHDGGQLVDETRPLGESFSELAMSHGLNLLTFNGLYRWGRGGPDQAASRFTPFVGVGLGVALPHVEVETGDSVTGEYQVAGPVVQVGGGGRLSFSHRYSAFAEYRLSYTDLRADLDGGGSLRTEAWTHHVIVGLTVSFQ